MMNRMTKASSYFAATLAIIGGSNARADVMPWSGASASVQVFGPASTQDGSTASVSSSKTQEVRYFGGIATDYTNPYRINVSGSATAQVTGQSDGLLQLNASYRAGNPGTTPRIQPEGTQLPVVAQATWSGDSAVVQSIGGGTVPSTIRLNFSVGFLNSANSLSNTGWLDGSGLSAVAITANGKTATIDGRDTGIYQLASDSRTYDFHSGTLAFDTTRSSQPLPPVPFGGLMESDHRFSATFHIDLAVNAAGKSDPFNVGLTASTAWGLSSNYPVISEIKKLNLSLTSITNTDGKLLSDLGETVTFASGMAAPVPEPSSFLVLGGLVVAFAAARLRRS